MISISWHRSILIKSEAHFDHYDVAFQEYFQGIEGPEDISEQIFDWLKNPLTQKKFFEEHPELFNKMELEELMRELEKRFKEQTEQHDGGKKWIGRGGNSPFGHSGYHPAGVQNRRRKRRQTRHQNCPGTQVPQLRR